MALLDNELLEKAKAAANGTKFFALWSGERNGYVSDSEADLALCDLLAFWTGPDPQRIDALFRQSARYRMKWDRDDYRNATIAKALEGRTDFYERPHVQADESGDPDAYELEPLDWQAIIRDGVPEIDYLLKPYFPRGARIWLWGPTAASKSIYALWSAATLSHRGERVSYFSEENPLLEDLRRLSKLQPDPEFFRIFHRTGMDLADPMWVASMLEATRGEAAVFFDSWTDLWRGIEDDNAAVRDFDSTVQKALQAQETTPIFVHHTGHPQMFQARKGASAGRGASSLGQKADVTLDFKAESDGSFTVIYGKPRIGGARQPDRGFRVVDTDDDRIDIVEIPSPRARLVNETVEKMTEAIETAPAGYLTTKELRTAAGGSREIQADALEALTSDERVITGEEKTPAGRMAKVWRSSARLV